MSLADSLTTIARSAAATASRTAARAADVVPVPGFVRGAVRGVAHALANDDRRHARGARADAWSAPETDTVPPPEPTALHEAVVTEPTAASRREAHGGAAGRHGDDWRDELDEAPDPISPAPGPGDEALIDPGTARAVRTEAEVMRRAARRAGSDDA